MEGFSAMQILVSVVVDPSGLALVTGMFPPKPTEPVAWSPEAEGDPFSGPMRAMIAKTPELRSAIAGPDELADVVRRGVRGVAEAWVDGMPTEALVVMGDSFDVHGRAARAGMRGALGRLMIGSVGGGFFVDWVERVGWQEWVCPEASWAVGPAAQAGTGLYRTEAALLAQVEALHARWTAKGGATDAA